MHRSLLAVATLVTGLTGACSSDGESEDGPERADVDLSAGTVESFVSEAAGDRLDCLDVPGGEEAGDFTTCLSDNAFSAHLYVFHDEEGAPARIVVAKDEDSYVSDNLTALHTTVLADLSNGEFEDAVTGGETTPFDGGAVKDAGDQVVVAVDEDSVDEPFPTLPAVDPTAVATALAESGTAQCTESDTGQQCRGAGVDASIDAVSGEDSPVTMNAQVAVTTDEHYFENVPEFLEAAGMPLTDDSLDALQECKPEQDPCQPRLVTETGLLVELMANFEFTMVDVTGFAPMG